MIEQIILINNMFVFFHSMDSNFSPVFIGSRHSFGSGVKMGSRFRINNVTAANCAGKPFWS